MIGCRPVRFFGWWILSAVKFKFVRTVPLTFLHDMHTSSLPVYLIRPQMFRILHSYVFDCSCYCFCCCQNIVSNLYFNSNGIPTTHLCTNAHIVQKNLFEVQFSQVNIKFIIIICMSLLAQLFVIEHIIFLVFSARYKKKLFFPILTNTN